MTTPLIRFTLTLVAAFSLLLTGCTKTDAHLSAWQAQAIESSDQCHLCGMAIESFPGPKGQMGSKDEQRIFKFCSTRDLFGFYLQPENQHRMQAVFVHDMSTSPWQSPDDKHFIDAESAFFVWGSTQQGAMGPTLGSFSTRADAEQFAREFGGTVLTFNEVTLELINQPAAMTMPHTSTEISMQASDHNH